ncbi:MAG TPA: hypothetical protein VGN16_15270 [Acidobacteriaceae bacterium]|jgi:hypothetical protein
MVRGFRIHLVVIPLLATLAVLPLLVHGCSCGHDIGFHVQSWLEAAQQLRHGNLYPEWAFSPAWQAGEPRFIFYPPLSWMLGAWLIALFPANAAPVIFAWIALTCAGFSMYRLAREFASPDAALLAAAVYMVNPYMLFNALERAAYAELFAAVWIPLILLAVLRTRPTALKLAVPLGFVWLTNAPAGVMATYAIVVLGVARLIMVWRASQRVSSSFRDSLREPLHLAVKYTAGVVFGLAMVGFYLIPAAYERRFVQVDMAIIPNLRFQDNFLFSRTDYEPHNVVTHSVSVLAVVMLLLTAAVLIAAFLLRKEREGGPESSLAERQALVALAVLTGVIGFLLLPVSSPVWAHLPDLKFLQFPWRLLAILAAVFTLALTPLLQRLRLRTVGSLVAATFLVAGLSQLGSHLYRQGCEADDLPSFAKQAFETGHGVPATDEYTPVDADNDSDRTDNPGYWLNSGDANAPAPGTIQNPNEIYANYDAPIPFEQTAASRAPQHLQLTLNRPETLVLNLRDYPAWHVIRNGSELSQHLHRDDGLIAVALPAGASTIDIQWQQTLDQKLGLGLSGYTFIVACVMFWRSRKIKAAR